MMPGTTVRYAHWRVLDWPEDRVRVYTITDVDDDHVSWDNGASWHETRDLEVVDT